LAAAQIKTAPDRRAEISTLATRQKVVVRPEVDELFRRPSKEKKKELKDPQAAKVAQGILSDAMVCLSLSWALPTITRGHHP